MPLPGVRNNPSKLVMQLPSTKAAIKESLTFFDGCKGMNSMLQLSCSLGFLFYAEAVDAGLRVGLARFKKG